MERPRLPDGREAARAGGRSLLEEWAKVHADAGRWREVVMIVQRLEKALEDIAAKRCRGYERSHAGTELHEMREEARVSLGQSTREPQVPRGL